jgi:2-(1,2-epoxy-1,2-dihydrophenyl)acetyl-CoA isomerase
MKRPPRGKADAGAGLEGIYHPIMMRLRDLPMPFIAAVNGPCAGVGMSFAMVADVVLASEKAFFLQAFRNIGLIPDGGATFMLPRLVGWGRAMEMAMLGQRVEAEKAKEWGLCSQVLPDAELKPTALAMASELAAGPTQTLSMIRQAYWQSFSNSYEEQLHVERKFQREAALTSDYGEGVKAFMEKRKAQFQGK